MIEEKSCLVVLFGVCWFNVATTQKFNFRNCEFYNFVGDSNNNNGCYTTTIAATMTTMITVTTGLTGGLRGIGKENIVGRRYKELVRMKDG